MTVDGTTIEEIRDDAAEIFHFSKEEKPQDRAHRYIERRRVERGYSDTAQQCAVLDLIRRAYEAGRADALAELDGLTEVSVDLQRISADLLGASLRLRGAVDDGK